MNRMPLLLIGIFLAFAAAWLGLVAYPVLVLGNLQPETDADSGDVSPPLLSGLAVAGQKVYAANGCVSCHSQMVRPAYLANDIAREMAVENGNEPDSDLNLRQTVARDYLRDQPAFIGLQRIGPDLANYGLEKRVATLSEIHRHLYDPRIVSPDSIMPSYRYLYSLREISGQPSNEALTGLTGPHAPEPGYEVVPTEDAKVLAAYLLSLKRNYPLSEAPEEPTE
jgi:cytochrome c oxidase cbb3-type subunit II